jgi:Ca2+-binding EF-hand superfamily protein
MNKSSRIALGAAAVVGLALVVGAVQFAEAHRRGGDMGWGGGWGTGRGMGDMDDMDAGMGGRDGMGPGRRMMLQAMLDRYDANKDGKLTQDEIDQNRTAWLGEFDADKSGGLSLKEFEGLWLKEHRQQMVREFQRFDRDGDGVVTLDEYKQPLASVVADRDRNGDKSLGPDDRPALGNGGGWGHHRAKMSGNGGYGPGTGAPRPAPAGNP